MVGPPASICQMYTIPVPVCMNCNSVWSINQVISPNLSHNEPLLKCQQCSLYCRFCVALYSHTMHQRRCLNYLKRWKSPCGVVSFTLNSFLLSCNFAKFRLLHSRCNQDLLLNLTLMKSSPSHNANVSRRFLLLQSLTPHFSCIIG